MQEPGVPYEFAVQRGWQLLLASRPSLESAQKHPDPWNKGAIGKSSWC